MAAAYGFTARRTKRLVDEQAGAVAPEQPRECLCRGDSLITIDEPIDCEYTCVHE
jgi:hypothetical protein